MRRLPLGAVAALVALVIAAGFGFHLLHRSSALGGTVLPSSAGTGAVEIGGPFTLVSHTGRTVSDADFRGSYLLVYFGYTYCPDVCPTTLRDIGLALDALGADAERVQPLFITIDPERDTVAVLADYVGAFHPRLIGLTGTAEQVARAAKAYGVFYAKVESKDKSEPYFMNHSAFTYLMGPDGRYLTVFPYGTKPKAMAAAIRNFLNPSTS